jgi:hypothetical protein
MGTRRKFSAEYKRGAVTMPDAPGVSVSQIADERGIGATVLGRWQRPVRTPVILHSDKGVSLPLRNTNGFWKRIRSSVA